MPKSKWLKKYINTKRVYPLGRSVHTFSRKTRNGCWKDFKLLLIEVGCMWTSRLLSYQTGWLSVAGLCLSLLRTTPSMPSSVAATLGYKPAHNIAFKDNIRTMSRMRCSYMVLIILYYTHLVSKQNHLIAHESAHKSLDECTTILRVQKENQ